MCQAVADRNSVSYYLQWSLKVSQDPCSWGHTSIHVNSKRFWAKILLNSHKQSHKTIDSQFFYFSQNDQCENITNRANTNICRNPLDAKVFRGQRPSGSLFRKCEETNKKSILDRVKGSVRLPNFKSPPFFVL